MMQLNEKCLLFLAWIYDLMERSDDCVGSCTGTETTTNLSV